MTLQLIVFLIVCSSSLKSIQAPECGAIGTALVLKNLLGLQPEALNLCVSLSGPGRAWLCLYTILRLQTVSPQNECVEHGLHAPSDSFPVCL